MNQTKNVRRKALRAAFPYTIPIFAGFWFLGISYGIYARVSGLPWFYPPLMAVAVFGGSLEFVTVSMLLGTFAPFQALLVALMVQARHLFYGLAMLEKYKNTGWKKPYLIYSLCDETFSINCAIDPPAGVDRSWFFFFVSALNQLYWVSGAAIGGLLGSLMDGFSMEGLDFVMTAMFVVIFLEQWLKDKKHPSELIGLLCSVVCLLIFGPDSFLIPAMACILLLLTVFRKPIEKAGETS